jgi:HK97 family phage major capsid protein/HK97 family phage prohead protease
MLANRAYALLDVKSVDAERRIITGWATTPTPDRVGDVIEPLGVSFRNPLPLLLHHDQKSPVGVVTFSTPTKAGIEFVAQLPVVDAPPSLKDRVDTAWSSIKAGLIRGVSIGFRVRDQVLNKDTGGFRILKSEVLELSLVTVPANADATIASLKSFDLDRPAVPGPGSSEVVRYCLPAAAGPTTNRGSAMYADQIKGLQATRAAKVAEREAIQTIATKENRTKSETEQDQFETLTRDISGCDRELKDLELLDAENIKAAKPVNGDSPKTASDSRGGLPVVQVKANVKPGTAYTRYIMATAAGKGDYFKTLEYARQWPETPEVELMVKAAVAVGSTTDATWAGPLVVSQPLNEFLELLRPRTLLGKIPGLRSVPFNVSVPSQTAGGTYAWVGQRVPKPVTAPAYATVTVPFSKAAGIIVISEELAKLSTPSAEGLIREEMIAGMAQFLDGQFVDPAVAAVANVSPASITNGASTAAASGATSAAAKADLAASVAVFTAANIPLEGSVWLMNDSNAFGIAMSVNALAQPQFPGMSIAGGSIFGIPVVVSNNVGNRVILAHAPSILVADEGGMRIDVSREASVQMDSAPTNPADASTVFVSLWQANLIGLRVERMITWIRARTAAVRYISAAAYVGS